MKKLIIPFILLLAVPALAGWDSWGSSTNNTGLGLFSVDSLSTKKVIASTTTGDSVIAYTGADATYIIFSINGSRDTLKATADLIEWSGGLTVPQSKAITCGNINSASGVYSLLFRNLYTNAPNADLRLWGAVGVKYQASIGYPDSTKGVLADSTGLTLRPMPPGYRPATARLGQLLMIDGTGTDDTLYVYLSGAWRQLK